MALIALPAAVLIRRVLMAAEKTEGRMARSSVHLRAANAEAIIVTAAR